MESSTRRFDELSSDTVKVGSPKLEVSFVESPHDFLRGFNVVFDLSVIREVSVGRSPENILVVPDPTVSRRHALITYINGKIVVRDLGSTNGTFVLEGNSFKRVGEYVFEREAVVRFGLYTVLRLSLRFEGHQ